MCSNKQWIRQNTSRKVLKLLCVCLMVISCKSSSLALALSMGAGVVGCRTNFDCFFTTGRVCLEGRCICDPDFYNSALFSCHPMRTHGDICYDDLDCVAGDPNLVCGRTNEKTCRCRKTFYWDTVARRCLKHDEHYAKEAEEHFAGLLDALIFPGIAMVAGGTIIYLILKLSCKPGALWGTCRRRELEVAAANAGAGGGYVPGRAHHQTQLVTFQRGNMLGEESSPFLGMSHHHHHPFLEYPDHVRPLIAPPPYEEALKHKVLLASVPVVITVPDVAEDIPLNPPSVPPHQTS